jgi:hypothetical protein
MSEPLWQPRTDRAARLLGAGFLIVGAGIFAFQVKVIVDAVAARTDVSYSLAAIALGAMAMTLGAYWLICGLAGYTAIRTLQTDRRRMRLFTVVTAVVLIVVVVGMRAWLGSLGYDQ